MLKRTSSCMKYKSKWLQSMHSYTKDVIFMWRQTSSCMFKDTCQRIQLSWVSLRLYHRLQSKRLLWKATEQSPTYNISFFFIDPALHDPRLQNQGLGATLTKRLYSVAPAKVDMIQFPDVGEKKQAQYRIQPFRSNVLLTWRITEYKKRNWE